MTHLKKYWPLALILVGLLLALVSGVDPSIRGMP